MAPESPRGAAELFDFDDLDAGAADRDAAPPLSESHCDAQPEPPLEVLAAAKANLRKVLGDEVEELLAADASLLPFAAERYEGLLSHPDLGEELPLSLSLLKDSDGWRGEWSAMDQSELLEVEVWEASVQIRSRGGETEFSGVVDARGCISGEVWQGGIGGGRLTLQPIPGSTEPSVPVDWAEIEKARDIFVPGWGGFDVVEAFRAFSEKTSPGKAIPSVELLRSYGYLQRFFPGVDDAMQRERLRRALLAPSSALAQYVVRHAGFWADAGHANRLDEVARHFSRLPPGGVKAATREIPRALLNRLSREQAVTKHTFVRFSHLSNVMKPAEFSGEGLPLPAGNSEAIFTLSVLEDSHSVAKAAQELNNCAAGYVGDVRRKRCALLVLRREGKLVAMGEWDLQDRKWSQISEHSDEPVRAEWQRMYDSLPNEQLFPPRALLQLPGGRGGTVSIFDPEAASSLDTFCRQSGLARCLMEDWHCLLPGSRSHSEASSALLLAVAEVQGSCDVAERLLREHNADVDVMSDQGWTALMMATENGQAEMVRLLLDAAADVDAKGADSGRTALMMAASAGSIPLVQALLDKKADLDVVARLSGKTALLEAAERSSWQAAEMLVAARAGLDAQRFDGKTALMLAAQAGKTELVSSMVAGDAKLDLQSDDGCTALLAAHDACRWPAFRVLVSAGTDLDALLGQDRLTMLMIASLAGQVETIDLLAKAGASTGVQNESGETALAMAVGCQQWASVQCLARLSADVNAKTSEGHTALTMAADVGNLALVKELAQQRANLDAAGPRGSTALAHAAVAGHKEAMRALASAQADLNTAGDGGESALVSAALAKKWPSVQVLIELEARLEVRDANNRTPLIIAAEFGHAKTVSSLLESKARLESRARDGSTALLEAARSRQWILVRRLADARADLEATTEEDGRTVLMSATEALQWETAAHLVRRRAEPNVSGDGGKTPLMLAVECGQDDVVLALLQRRADPDTKDGAGDTPLLRACNRQLERIMRILFQNGASIEEAVSRASIPRMANVLLKWSGADVEDL